MVRPRPRKKDLGLKPEVEDLKQEPKKEKITIRVRLNPFKWDGSFLGEFSQDVILNCTESEKLKYVELKIWAYRTFGILVSSKTPDLLCIYDELKDLFGLMKTGTHSIKIKGKTYVLYRAIYSNPNLVSKNHEAVDDPEGPVSGLQFDEELTTGTLDKWKHLTELKGQIKNLLAYRHLLGVSPNSESGIKIRKTGTGMVYPISLNDKFSIDQKEGIKNGKRSISDKNFEKWFLGESFAEAIQKMLHFRANDSIPETISVIRDRITDTVHRINREFIWLENIICGSLVDYLEDFPE